MRDAIDDRVALPKHTHRADADAQSHTLQSSNV
jgi:hypothetical protein